MNKDPITDYKTINNIEKNGYKTGIIKNDISIFIYINLI